MIHWTLLALVTVAIMGGCRYEKVVSYNPMMSGLPGATVGSQVTRRGDGRTMDVLAPPPGGIVQEDADGNVVLYARSGRHLMVHIYQTLADNNAELFVQQVLSKRTRDEFIVRGYDPVVGFDELKRRERDILKLFNAMPNGEYTPGIYLKRLNKDEYRLEVTGLGKRGLKWSRMDMVLEHGNFKLRWFGP